MKEFDHAEWKYLEKEVGKALHKTDPTFLKKLNAEIRAIKSLKAKVDPS